MRSTLAMLVLALMLAGCGHSSESTVAPLPPVDTPSDDGSVVHGRAIYEVGMYNEYALMKLLMPSAYAASSGSTTVTYTNAASTNFTIDVSQFTAGGFTGDTLSLGKVALAGLNDNNLKVCGAGNNTQCTKAIIRVYTTGSIAGFVNTADSYGAPVYAGSLNPTSALGLNAAGSVQVQTYTIPSNQHKVTISNFPTPQYNVTSDFSNAGAGNYSMTFVVEYALQ